MPVNENAAAPEPLDTDSAAIAATTETAGGGSCCEPDDESACCSAMGSAHVSSLASTASLIGLAAVEGDASIRASVAPLVFSQGTTTVQQSYASAVIVGGGAETRIHQAAAPIIVGKTTEMVQSGAGVLVSGETDVRGSWVGIVVSPKTTISEDSRVLISPTAALIIGLALMTGIGLVALVAVLLARRAYEQRRAAFRARMPHLPHFPDLSGMRAPDLSAMHAPDFSAMAKKVRELKRRSA